MMRLDHRMELSLLLLTFISSSAQDSKYFERNRQLLHFPTHNRGLYTPLDESERSTDRMLSQPSVSNKMDSLIYLIPEFQVNDNAGEGEVNQLSPNIAVDGDGNSFVTWVNFNAVHHDIYARRFSNEWMPIGEQFRVNDINTQWTVKAEVACNRQGDAVVVWNKTGSIYGQRFTKTGEKLGSNFKVNTEATESVPFNPPSVAMNNEGHFIIVWCVEKGGANNVYAQHFTKDGTPEGSNFIINDISNSVISYTPHIISNETDRFLATWIDKRGYNRNQFVYAQLFDIDGTPLGDNFRIDEDQKNESVRHWMATDPDGNFVIAWSDIGRDIDVIYCRRFTNDGLPTGDVFHLNSSCQRLDTNMFFTIDENGTNVMAWVEHLEYIAEGKYICDVFAQRFESDGTASGEAFHVNDTTGIIGGNPSVVMAVDESSNLTILWVDWRNQSPGFMHADIFAQRYASDGSIIGSNFKVNDEANMTNQYQSSIAVDDNGNFVVVWLDVCGRDSTTYYDYYNIIAQFYSKEGIPQGNNIKINEGKSVLYGKPSVGMDGRGNAVVAWEDTRNAQVHGRNWNVDIYMQRLSKCGQLVGSNVRVNDDDGEASQGNCDLDMNLSGDFIIVWSDYRNDRRDIYAQYFTSDGHPFDTNFMVNESQTVRHNPKPSVAMSARGDFIIAWSEYYESDKSHIHARLFLKYGKERSSIFKVSTHDATGLEAPSFNLPTVAADYEGNFIVAWSSDLYKSDYQVFAQRYSHDGNPINGNFKVNSTTAKQIYYCTDNKPLVSLDASGHSTIAWVDGRDNRWDVYIQRYLKDGSPVGENINLTNRQKYQWYPDIKLWNDRIYTTWTDDTGVGTGLDIWASVIQWVRPRDIQWSFILNPNYPNPFNISTTFTYYLTMEGYVDLIICNIIGQKIRTITIGHQEFGFHSAIWDGTDNQGRLSPSGVYFCTFRVNGETCQSMKMVLLR